MLIILVFGGTLDRILSQTVIRHPRAQSLSPSLVFLHHVSQTPHEQTSALTDARELVGIPQSWCLRHARCALQYLEKLLRSYFWEFSIDGGPHDGARMWIDLSISIPDKKAALPSKVALDMCKLTAFATAVCTKEVVGVSILMCSLPAVQVGRMAHSVPSGQDHGTFACTTRRAFLYTCPSLPPSPILQGFEGMKFFIYYRIKQRSNSSRSGPVKMIFGTILATLFHELRGSGSTPSPDGLVRHNFGGCHAHKVHVVPHHVSPFPSSWRPRRSTHVRICDDTQRYFPPPPVISAITRYGRCSALTGWSRFYGSPSFRILFMRSGTSFQ